MYVFGKEDLKRFFYNYFLVDIYIFLLWFFFFWGNYNLNKFKLKLFKGVLIYVLVFFFNYFVEEILNIFFF